MEKEYKYENAYVRIIVPDDHSNERVRKATEEFLRKVIEKENQNGNKHTTRDIEEKSVLDK